MGVDQLFEMQSIAAVMKNSTMNENYTMNKNDTVNETMPKILTLIFFN